ncbi:hypothetical protein [Brevibacillus agri]|uniref:hypothetical protein n=1 Tax=Brevibacillus agri TaxID=51101 RepID=UPI00286808DB|nr:hypothetical protein [Brevibacillus agri]
MDLAYVAESTIQTQKVVQLKPNGKIANLPLATNLNMPSVVMSISNTRTVNTDATAIVKLTDTLYLISYVNYDDVNPDPYRFILLEKQSDGTYREKANVPSPYLYGGSARFYKLSATKVLFFYNDSGSGDIAVGVLTISGYTLSFSTKQVVSVGVKSCSNIVSLKETADQIYFVGITYGAAACIFAFTYDKVTDLIAYQTKVTLYNADTTLRASNLCTINENKIAVGFVRQYTPADHKYVMAGYFSITYDGNGAITAIAQAGPLTQDPTALNYNATHYYDAIEFKGDYIHFDIVENYSTYRNLDILFQLTDPAANKVDFIGRKQVSASRNRTGVFYLDSRKEKWQYEVVNETNPHECRVDMYCRNTYFDSTVVPDKLIKTWKIGLGQQLSYVKIIKVTDEEELFLLYVSNTSPFTTYLAAVDPNALKAIPIGVARSQSLVTLNGRCGGFTGLQVGKQYYYDENGDISTNPQGTYLGTAISANDIFIESTLF